jgi:hypothetical protein
VASEANGTWHAAIPVPGVSYIDGGFVQSLSCSSPGNCAAGGTYQDGAQQSHAFVANEISGTWQAAIEVPGTTPPNENGSGADLSSVSCASAGNCAAGGSYTDAQGHGQGFVASEINGPWQTAIDMPGSGTLSTGGGGGVASVSCAPAGSCAATGLYMDSSGHLQVFVASQS